MPTKSHTHTQDINRRQWETVSFIVKFNMATEAEIVIKSLCYKWSRDSRLIKAEKWQQSKLHTRDFK